jgi:hypothetical protein
MSKDVFTRGNAIEELRKRYNEIVDNAKNYRDMTIQTTFHFDEMPTIRYDITEVIVPEECVTGEVRQNDE